MTSQDEAVDSLLSIVDPEPYRTTKSWVRTLAYTQDPILIKLDELPFCIDERFAGPKKL
jgi:hypothetical protein